MREESESVSPRKREGVTKRYANRLKKAAVLSEGRKEGEGQEEAKKRMRRVKIVDEKMESILTHSSITTPELMSHQVIRNLLLRN